MINKVAIELAIDRLNAIADVEDLARHFDLGFWGNQIESHPLSEEEKLDCGFTGCFMGWAAHQQWFDQFGLVLRLAMSENYRHLARSLPDMETRMFRNSVYPVVDPRSASIFAPFKEDPGRSDSRTTSDAIKAVGQLFGIEPTTMDRLIYEEHYDDGEKAGPLQVVEKLRQLLDLGEEGFLDVDCAAEERRREDSQENAG